MPTPPPWWSETQLAPQAVLSSALSSGQSAIASEPSFIASVSRLGEATEPVSRWSRPITIGARTLPFFTSQLNRSPISARSPYSSQQIRAGSPWKCTLLLRLPDPARQRVLLRERLQHRLVGHGDVGRVAGERRPAERPGAPAEERADEGRHEAGDVERLASCRGGRPPGPAGCCRSRRRRRPRALSASIARTCATIESSTPALVARRIASRAARPPRRATARPGCSRRAGRAPRSGR